MYVRMYVCMYVYECMDARMCARKYLRVHVGECLLRHVQRAERARLAATRLAVHLDVYVYVCISKLFAFLSVLS